MAGGLWGGLENNCSTNCRPCCRPYHTGLFALLSVCLSVRLSVCFVSFSVRLSVCMYGCLLVYCVSVWDLPLTTNNEKLKSTTPNVGKFVITFKIKIPPCTLSTAHPMWSVQGHKSTFPGGHNLWPVGHSSIQVSLSILLSYDVSRSRIPISWKILTSRYFVQIKDSVAACSLHSLLCIH